MNNLERWPVDDEGPDSALSGKPAPFQGLTEEEDLERQLAYAEQMDWLQAHPEAMDGLFLEGSKRAVAPVSNLTNQIPTERGMR